mmetsp:Transcript_17505/g.44874  ORF Transcript_17505/g.44874 Transcript_17505/m.44874 type:complete len:91 (+) Transcript_17505:351-623(+)
MTPASGGSRENEPSMPHMQALCRASWRGVMREIVQTKALLPLNAMAANKSSEQRAPRRYFLLQSIRTLGLRTFVATAPGLRAQSQAGPCA